MADGDADKALAPDRIDQFLPPDILPYLKSIGVANDELWVLAEFRRLKEHGYGQIIGTVNDGELVQLDTTERRRNLGELELSMP